MGRVQVARNCVRSAGSTALQLLPSGKFLLGTWLEDPELVQLGPGGTPTDNSRGVARARPGGGVSAKEAFSHAEVSGRSRFRDAQLCRTVPGRHLRCPESRDLLQ